MNIAVYSTIFLVALVVLSLVGRIIRKKNGDESVPVQQESAQPITAPASEEEDDDEECCGEHEVCEKGKIKRALRTDIEYFDDEELDRFRGTAPDEYDDDAVEEFREAYAGFLGHPGISLIEVQLPLRGVKDRYAPYQA